MGFKKNNPGCNCCNCPCSYCDGGDMPSDWQIDIAGGSNYDGTYFTNAIHPVFNPCCKAIGTIAIADCCAGLGDTCLLITLDANVGGFTVSACGSGGAADVYANWLLGGLANPRDCTVSRVLAAFSSFGCSNAGTTATITPI